ncbi:MAG: IS66 family transposase [Haliscomenobacter sp.]|nr:IS66 family transposase [Haliscomenobacter sp.]
MEGSVLFVYEKGRAGKYVRDHLSTFSGYLQTDAYTAYDSMPANEGVTMVGCWAHVRRKFADALVVEQEQASYFVEQIQRLYAIERFCRTEGLSADARLDARAQAKPILAGIKTRMLDLAPTLTPKNALSIAIHYTLKQWDELLVYTTNGILEIDNNLVENSIRPIALGRKNYLLQATTKQLSALPSSTPSWLPAKPARSTPWPTWQTCSTNCPQEPSTISTICYPGTGNPITPWNNCTRCSW